MQGCLLCGVIESGARRVFEFETSVLTVGEHQFFPGYCVLVLNRHVRDLHELSELEYASFLQELRRADRAIVAAYQPAKMNHASYGNAVPHLHWHLFPRTAEDPDRTQSPWTHQARFGDFATTAAMVDEVRSRLEPHLGSR